MDLDDLYRLLRGAHVQAQGVVDTVRDPLLVLDADLCVVSANHAFYEVFAADRETTLGTPLYELGAGQWDIEELRVLLENSRAGGCTLATWASRSSRSDSSPRWRISGAV